MKKPQGRPYKGYPKPFKTSDENLAKRIFQVAEPTKPVEKRDRRNRKKVAHISYKKGYKYQLTADYSTEINIQPNQLIDSDYISLTASGAYFSIWTMTRKLAYALGLVVGTTAAT